jgi:DNA-binding MarR family transcriptional regulator
MVAKKTTATLSWIEKIRLISHCWIQKEEEICHHLGLTISQLECLAAWPQKNTPMTIHQVANSMALSHSRSSRVVDSLVRHGLLCRMCREKDRRTQWVALTMAGKVKWQEVYKVFDKYELQLRDRISIKNPPIVEEVLQCILDAW